MTETARETRSAPEDITVRNPRNGELLYTIPAPSEQEVAATYARAREAFKTLKAMTVRERLEEASKLKRYLLEHREEIARKIVSETGKCLTDALMLELFPRLTRLTITRRMPNGSGRSARQDAHFPLRQEIPGGLRAPGAVLVISPWNTRFTSRCAHYLRVYRGKSGDPQAFELHPLKGCLKITGNSGFMKDASRSSMPPAGTPSCCSTKDPPKSSLPAA